MKRIELHHYRTSAGRPLTTAMLATDAPESGKAWTTRRGCGHKHRSDVAAVTCAGKAWPGIPVTEMSKR